MLSGCGGGSSSSSPAVGDDTTSGTDKGTEVNILAPQSGTQSHLFYGNSKHAGLGSLKNVMVIDTGDTDAVVASNEVLDVDYPVVTTTFTYDAGNKYKDLYADTLSYVSGDDPYKIVLKKGSGAAEEVANSAESNITGTGRGGSHSYQKLDYLGSRQYLTVKGADESTLLIAPEMSGSDAAVAFDDKSLLTLTYPEYGVAADGYVVYDSNTSSLQECTTDMVTCIEIADVDPAPTFLGDVGGTLKSVMSISDEPYILDKSDNSMTKIAGVTLPVKVGHSTPYELNGESIYFVENGNISRVDLDGTVKQISTDGKAEGFRAFTNDMVIYGGDDEMHAVMKDGSISTAAIEISVTTKTRGQKYPFNMGIGDHYLYTTYSLNTQTGNTTFSACKLEDGKKECREDSFWSAITAAKDGSLNFGSTYKYTPYAYIRVDNTDNYGGGTLKAIDPEKPLEDGLTLGTIATYNFQTFMQNSRYVDEMVDSDGNVIIYAKNDVNFRGDAFLVNLNKENSLKNLTNEPDPDIADINSKDGGHCHGRFCSVCHSFAGGKIYEDKAGTASASGHSIRFEFEDGSESLLANIRKGEGENFNTPLEGLVGKDFKAVVVDEAGTAVVSSVGYHHEGVEYFNCNFCHARAGVLRHEAPNVITIED